MLRQPAAAEPATADGAQVWLVLATDRLAEFHAVIHALDARGRITRKPSQYLTFATGPEAWFRDMRVRPGALDHARYTYTVFRAE